MVNNKSSGNFKIHPFEVDNIKVNVFGLAYYVNQYDDGHDYKPYAIQKEIEVAVDKFIQNLKVKNDFIFKKLDFFGDVHLRNGKIESVPIYFIKLDKNYQLFRITRGNPLRLELLCENKNYNELINYLEAVDSDALEYYDNDEDDDDEGNDEGNENDKSDEDDEEEISGIYQEDITGDYTGSIIGIMNGDILGTLKGNIIGVLNGNIHKDLYGDITGVLNGNIFGDVHGDISGIINGNIHGDVYGMVSGFILGKIYGKIRN